MLSAKANATIQIIMTSGKMKKLGGGSWDVPTFIRCGYCTNKCESIEKTRMGQSVDKPCVDFAWNPNSTGKRFSRSSRRG